MKIKRYAQLKIPNVSMPAVHLIYVTTEMIKSLQYIYNKHLISYIEKNPWTMMIYRSN